MFALSPPRRTLPTLLVLSAVAACGDTARAVINNPADSSTFPFKYEGDAATFFSFGTTGYTGSINGYSLAPDSPSPGLLDVSIDTNSANPGLIVYLASPDFASSATETNGWTWEARLKMNSGQFTVKIGDDTDPHDIVDIISDGRITSRINGTLTTLPSTTDGFYTYRIAQAPNSDEYNVWVDDALVGEYNAADTGIGTGGLHWFSDGSGSTQGEYELDFLRFSAGGFSPTGFTPFDPTRFIWAADGLARWDDGGSWNQPGAPNDNMTTAVFGDAITSPRTAVVNGNFTVKALEFDSPNAYAVAGLGGITLEADAGTASINVLDSPVEGHQIQVQVTLNSDTEASTAAGTRLDINNTIILNGNTFTISPGSTINLNNGTVDDAGGLLVNFGALAAAAPLQGSLLNESSGVLALEVAGVESTSASRLSVSGEVMLGGVVDVSLAAEAPSVGDQFTVLTAGGGLIDNGFRLSGTPGFVSQIQGNDLILTYVGAVPEPASCALLFVCGAVVLAARRRPRIRRRAAPNLLAVAVTLAGVTIDSPAGAVINNPANSSGFAFKYEGDAASLATFGNTGYAGGTDGYILTGDSPSPGLLDVSIDNGSLTPGLIVYLQSSNWSATATDATGWTWEASLRMKTGQFVVRIGDAADPHTILTINSNGQINNFFTGRVATLPSTTDALHTYRVAQSATSGQYDLWIDGSYVTSLKGNSQLGTGGPHWWSDGSGSTSGEYELDYVRFASGGFSPLGAAADPNRLVWTSTALGQWGDVTNWSNSNSAPGVPNGSATTAVFSGADFASRTVAIDGDYTIKAIEFDATNNSQYGLVGLGSLTLSSNAGSAAINVANSPAAGHEFQVAVELASNTDVSTAPGSSVQFNNLLNLGGNTLSVTTGSTAAINNNLDSGTSGTLDNQGNLFGTGRVNGSLVNGGRVAPGAGVGVMTVDGNYTQTAGSSLDIQLAGPADFDLLNITGSATLAGSLDVSLLSYAPAVAEDFVVLTAAGGITDNGISLTGESGFSYNIMGNDLVLTYQAIVSSDADFNGDSVVNGADFLIWQRGVGLGGQTDNSNGDANGDGFVNGADLTDWETQFGQPAPSAASAALVPEPAAIAIMAIGCLAAGGCRTTRRRLATK